MLLGRGKFSGNWLSELFLAIQSMSLPKDSLRYRNGRWTACGARRIGMAWHLAAMLILAMTLTGCGGAKDVGAPADSQESKAGDLSGDAATDAPSGADLYLADEGGAGSPVDVGKGEVPVQLQPRTRPDEQLLILEVRLRDLILNEGMFGYVDEGGLLLPLSEFARTLEFPISVDPVNGRASGWYISEDRFFSLDILSREVRFDGRKLKFNRHLVELHEDEIFVDARLLADWFPVDIQFDLGNLTVMLHSREPLPLEQRMTRDVRRGKALAQRERREKDFREVDLPYAWASWPMVNLNAETGYSADATGAEFVHSQYGLLANGDLLKHSASLFVGGNQEKGVSDVRFQMGRKEPDGEMLGFLRATEYSMGDIVTPPVELVARSRFGRGAELSSFPLVRTGKFDSTTIVGELPLGWEVELNRNGVLLDFRASRSDGRYEFADVPLLFGLNIIQLQFFGPQGQYREETRRILVGPGQVPPGKVNFRIAASQQDERLVPLENGTTLSAAEQALQGEPRASLELEYGATKYLSFAASATTLPLVAGRRSYGGLGLRFGAGGMYGRLDVVRDNLGGTAGKIGTQFNLPFNIMLVAEQGLYKDFSSEDILDDGDLPVSTTEGRLDGVVPLWQGRRLPFSFTGAYEKSESGATTLDLGNRLSLSLGRLSMSNSLQWQRTRTVAGETISSGGSLLVGGRLLGIGIRGNLGYTMEPDSAFTTASVSAERLFGAGMSARAGAARSFATAVNTYSAGISRRFSAFSVGLNGSYSDNDSAAVLLTFGLSAARDPHDGDWSLYPDEIASKGAASARVFLDNDFDGVFSEGDEPVPGAKFETGHWLATRETDENGVVMLTGLPPYTKIPIALPPRGLVDPYWVAQPEGYVTPLRPGVAAQLDFPIVVTGEVDGTVMLRQRGTLLQVADVVIQLVDTQGQVVGEAKSSFDGFYLLEGVRPGVYSVRVDPDQMQRLGLVPGTPRTVEIKGDGTIASGIDFVVGGSL